MAKADTSVTQAPVSINDEPDNTSTELEKACEAERNERNARVKKFWASLAAYRQSQTTILLIMAREEGSDEEMGKAIDEQGRAIHDILATPIGAAYQFMDKFEVVEELITKEDVAGQSRDRYRIRRENFAVSWNCDKEQTRGHQTRNLPYPHAGEQ